MELTQMKIGTHIAALRRARGLTQEQLADKLGVSAPAVSKWETDSSYPDITLLCPLARALDTNVDNLLQFEETLSDQEVIRRINTLMEETLRTDSPAGTELGEAGLEELLRRYPNCAALKFNAAAVYDSFQMFFPTSKKAVRQRWRARKRALLEEVRAGSSAAYWQAATLQLAGLAVAEGELERAEAMLKELPEHVGDPAVIWAQYFLKRGEPEEALKITQKQLYKLVNQTQTCLATLLNPGLLSQPEKIFKVGCAYRAVARVFGLPDMSDGLLLEPCLRMGRTEQAAACFARYVDALIGPAVYPDEDLFAPGLTCRREGDRLATTQELRRMLLNGIEDEERLRTLREDPAFAAALEKLKKSVDAR